jgi:magnesium transporter
MNFDHMSELHTAHGYFYASLFTLVTTVLMAVYLKKKRWF